jgi:hypothetical protein
MLNARWGEAGAEPFGGQRVDLALLGHNEGGAKMQRGKTLFQKFIENTLSKESWLFGLLEAAVPLILLTLLLGLLTLFVYHPAEVFGIFVILLIWLIFFKRWK